MTKVSAWSPTRSLRMPRTETRLAEAQSLFFPFEKVPCTPVVWATEKLHMATWGSVVTRLFSKDDTHKSKKCHNVACRLHVQA